MKKLALTVVAFCAVALLALVLLPLNQTEADAREPSYTPAGPHESTPWQPAGIRCEVECEDGTDGGLLFCAEPTFEDCCKVAERICNDEGGLASGECEQGSNSHTC
ncbi:MAG: hypothetical protein AAF481_13190 [Acidobacteriota bacterium]